MKILDKKKFMRKLRYIRSAYNLSPLLFDKICNAIDSSMYELIDCRDNWISVKDQLPPNRGERYLCYFDFESTQDTPNVISENTYIGSGHWLSETDAVTHWMPLPSSPIEFVYKEEHV